MQTTTQQHVKLDEHGRADRRAMLRAVPGKLWSSSLVSRRYALDRITDAIDVLKAGAMPGPLH